jgi:hypothetical protein
MFELSKSARLTAALVAAGSLALVGVAQADVAAPEAVIVGEEIVVVEAVVCADCPAGNNGMISISAGVDLYDKYFFRGYTQQTKGLQVQPWAELGIQLVDNGDGAFGDVSLFIGTWNSVTSSGLGFGDAEDTRSPANFYESDFYVGVSTSLGAGVSASASYIVYAYPSSGGDIGEVDIALSYDDSEHLGNFALSPYVLFAFETSNSFTDTDAGYFEFGIEPSYTLMENSDYPISISTPMALGVSMYEGYYGDNTAGWGTVGGAVSVPLAFVPAGYGDWSASGGVYGIWQSAAIRSGSAWQPNVGMGISMAY